MPKLALLGHFLWLCDENGIVLAVIQHHCSHVTYHIFKSWPQQTTVSCGLDESTISLQQNVQLEWNHCLYSLIRTLGTTIIVMVLKIIFLFLSLNHEEVDTSH